MGVQSKSDKLTLLFALSRRFTCPAAIAERMPMGVEGDLGEKKIRHRVGCHV